MKIGVFLPNYARWFRHEGISAACEKAKEIGFDALFYGDHIIVTPTQYVGYGNGYMDIWDATAYTAAITNAMGYKPILSTCVVVIPYRQPIQQAKTIATIDSLSGGRIVIGAGSGYNENEFRALGLNIKERGEMADEYLACMKELWTNRVASFHGKYVNFDEMTISVQPAQKHIPIMYGATGPRPFRRIAERYDGWLPGPRGTVEGLRQHEQSWAEINRLWKEYGREGKPRLWLAPRFCHLATSSSEIGTSVKKGLESSNPGAPQTVVLAGGHTYQRYDENSERTYLHDTPVQHTDVILAEIRAYADMGAEMYVLHFPSYKYKGLNNQELLLSQMELFAEHILPKVPKG